MAPASRTLAPGYTFCPPDSELTDCHLRDELAGKPIPGCIHRVDVYSMDPEHLVEKLAHAPGTGNGDKPPVWSSIVAARSASNGPEIPVTSDPAWPTRKPHMFGEVAVLLVDGVVAVPLTDVALATSEEQHLLVGQEQHLRNNISYSNTVSAVTSWEASMTKSSSNRKNKSAKKHSKLTIMRRKLTLKPRVSPVHCKIEIEEKEKVEDINEEANLVMEEEHFQNDTTAPDVPLVLSQAKRKKLLQRASPMKLIRLYPSISIDQKTMIRNAYYGGLLEIKCSKLQPDLCRFLMESFDSASCCLVFPGRGSIPITEDSVHQVIGVPRGKIEVLYELNADAIKFMKEEIGVAGKKQPTIKSLEKKLLTMNKADSKYLRLFITYAMCSVLAPTTGVHISPRIYPSLINIKQAKNLNVCKFVITMIQEATQSSSEKAILKSCMLYIMVKYLDSLDLPDMDISAEGTRVSVWTNAMVRKAIMLDTADDGSFGNAPFKPEFAYTYASETTDRDLSTTRSDPIGDDRTNTELNNQGHESSDRDESMQQSHAHGQDDINAEYQGQSNTTFFPDQVGGKFDDIKEEEYEDAKSDEYNNGQSILFADPDVIDKFIRHNAPANCTEHDTSRFKEAIEYACHGFEASLQMLVRNLPARPPSQNRTTSRNQQISSQEELGKSNESVSNREYKQQASTKDDDKGKNNGVDIEPSNRSVPMDTMQKESNTNSMPNDDTPRGQVKQEELEKHADGNQVQENEATTSAAIPPAPIEDRIIQPAVPVEADEVNGTKADISCTEQKRREDDGKQIGCINPILSRSYSLELDTLVF
ncbi:hypothetical protein ACQ4PT_046598 [Festuca glaucescens]